MHGLPSSRWTIWPHEYKQNSRVFPVIPGFHSTFPPFILYIHMSDPKSARCLAILDYLLAAVCIHSDKTSSLSLHELQSNAADADRSLARRLAEDIVASRASRDDAPAPEGDRDENMECLSTMLNEKLTFHTV